MKFSKEFMQERVVEDGDLTVYDKIVETTRWSEIHEIVFKYEDKFYLSSYSCGLTEYQDESPYEYEDEMVEVVEVEPREVKVTKYLPVGGDK